jgi:tetratricopeptide (TPR) repeat protein
MLKPTAFVPPPRARLEPWVVLTILLLTAVIYGPAVKGEFLWDDRPGHVTRPELQSWDGLGRIWFEIGATQQYYPVLHSAFWIEHRLWGDATAGYHLTNLLLHALAACLFGTLLLRLGVRGAAWAALLFTVHPVCVESVAWISEQKNTLSTVFYLTAALAYLRFDRDRTKSAYVAATAWFLLALLTKTVTATLPAALLVVGWWRRGRLSWRDDLQPLLPWFTFSVAAGILTAWVESTLIGAHGVEFSRGLIERCLLPGRVIAFYLWKLVWPANLAFIYPRWRIDAADAWAYLYPIGFFAALAWLWWRRDRARGPLATALFFAGTLFPVLGFFNVFPFRYSFVADHFQYLACLGPLTAAAFGLSCLRARLRAIAGVLMIAALVAVSGIQSSMYRDLLTLYEWTIARNPDSWMAQNNLAEALAARGRPAEAIPHLEVALRLKPDSPEAENDLGDDLRQIGRPEDGIVHIRKALAMQPAFPEALNNLGVAELALGRSAEGRADFEAALKLKPKFPLAHFNLGLALANAGDVSAAISHFREAVAQQPDYADAEINWGIAVLLTRGFSEAEPHLRRAIELDPDSADAHFALGRAFAQQRQWGDAVGEFQTAVRLNPTRGDLHYNLALALRETGRTAEAAAEMEEASRLR